MSYLGSSTSYLDWRQTPLLYLVRHGRTVANETGLFRGHVDYPLNDDGMEDAQEAAHYLSFRPIGFVACSPLKRAVQMSQVIGPAVQQDFDRNPGLYPWNIGEFAGKPKAKYADALQRYVREPDLVVPGGESLTAFRQRMSDTLFRYLAQASYQQPGVLVTHTSNITVAHQVLDPDWTEMAPEDADMVEPGGIVAVCISIDNKAELVPVLGAVVNENKPTVT